MELNETIIIQYTGEDAIEDGSLIDVSDTAKQLNYKWPVRITRHLYTQLLSIPSSSADSYDGRLWDVLWMLSVAMKTGSTDDMLKYKVILPCGREPEEYEDGMPIHTLYAAIDTTNGYPAINIMFLEDY